MTVYTGKYTQKPRRNVLVTEAIKYVTAPITVTTN